MDPYKDNEPRGTAPKKGRKGAAVVTHPGPGDGQTVTKTAGAVRGGGTPTEVQLAQINRQAKTALTAEEVYVFSLRLCDDQVDREDERFDTAALPVLARLMVGKTGLSDHQWRAGAQVARIFDATVESDGIAHYIRAWAYVLRAHQAQLIAEIEGGIRREVSIGCAMGQRRCSICGAELGSCQHIKGQVYDGQRCVAVLSQPVDAYEFSFVAVPAQPEAGVMKRLGGHLRLEALARAQGGSAWEDYQTLRAAAALGEQQLARQREELVRLGLGLELGLERPLLERMAGGLAAADVEQVCTAWRQAMRARYPAQTQLQPVSDGDRDEAFRI